MPGSPQRFKSSLHKNSLTITNIIEINDKHKLWYSRYMLAECLGAAEEESFEPRSFVLIWAVQESSVPIIKEGEEENEEGEDKEKNNSAKKYKI